MTNYEKVLTACLEIYWITLNSGLQKIIVKRCFGSIWDGEKVSFSLGKYICEPFPTSL